jgi:hypothetical protein
MDILSKMSTADKITLLNEIKNNYSAIKKYWPLEKVQALEVEISLDMQMLGRVFNSRKELENVNIPDILISIDDALLFAEYFSTNFEYYDSRDIGRVYKRRDLFKRSEPAITMTQIFEDWRLSKV